MLEQLYGNSHKANKVNLQTIFQYKKESDLHGQEIEATEFARDYLSFMPLGGANLDSF